MANLHNLLHLTHKLYGVFRGSKTMIIAFHSLFISFLFSDGISASKWVIIKGTTKAKLKQEGHPIGLSLICQLPIQVNSVDGMVHM